MRATQPAFRSTPGPHRAKSARRLARGDRGQALVEMAIAAPLLICILLTIAVGSDMFNAYLTVVNTGRDGARIGSSGATADDICLTVASDMERLRGSFDCVEGLTITNPETDSIRVEVCYDHPHLLAVPIISDVISNPLPMCSATEMPVSPFAGS